MAAPVVNGAKGFHVAIGILRESTVAVRDEKGFKRYFIKSGHVTRNNEVPFRSGRRKSGFDTGQRTRSGESIGDHGESQYAVFRGIADKRNRAADSRNFFCSLHCERAAVNLEKSFVSAHAAAATAGEYPARSLRIRQSIRMVALNIPLRICFILMLAMPAFAAHITITVHADVKSGKLERTSTVPAPVAQSIPPESMNSLIDRIAQEEGVETPLVHSVIKTESNYNPAARSLKGAQGMMQLIPSTAKRFGVINAFDVTENIQGGVRYLRFLLNYYHDDYVKAIAAYNAGEGAVDRYKGIPPYAETQNYVVRVAKNLKAARAVKTAELKKLAAVEPVATAPPIVASLGTDGLLYYRTP